MKRTPLKRGKALLRRTPLRRRSRKTEALYRLERIPLVRGMLADRPWCERCENHKSQDIHEVLPRGRGGSITDPANCVALCRACHMDIHDHPAQSMREGWLVRARRGNAQ
jgi:hypothetical protein